MPKVVSRASQLGKLQKSAERLNQLTDQAATVVKNLEQYLSEKCSVGVSASAAVFEADDPNEESRWLSYERVGGNFRVNIVSGPEVDPECWDVTPWSDCPRDVKLESIKFLPDLIDAIGETVDAKIAEAEPTLKSIAQIIPICSDKRG